MAIFQPGIFSSGDRTKPIPLLSITTEPSGEYPKGSKYFRESDSKIVTSVEDGTWDGAKLSDPVWGAYYLYDGHAYVWDGNSLEIFELNDYQLTKDKTNSYSSQSTTTYTSSKALYDGLATKESLSNKAQNFEDSASTTKYPSVKAVADYVFGQGIAHNFDAAGITMTTSSYTFPQLAEEIRQKQFATGTTLYGEVRNSGMPTGISNAEIRVEVLETKSTVNPQGSTYKSQVIEFTLFSTDVDPKEWAFIYYDQRNVDWAWTPKAVPSADYTSTSTVTVPTSKALSDGLATKQDTLIEGTGINITDNTINAEAVVIKDHTSDPAITTIYYGTVSNGALTTFNTDEDTQAVGYKQTGGLLKLYGFSTVGAGSMNNPTLSFWKDTSIVKADLSCITEIMYDSMVRCFSDNGNLEEIDFSNLEVIGSQSMTYAFWCQTGPASKLKTIKFDSLRTIEARACTGMFSNCNQLTDVTFPSLEILGYDGCQSWFWSCKGLKTVHFPAVIKVSHQTLYSAFGYCTALTDIYFDALNTDSFSITEYGSTTTYLDGFQNMLTGTTGVTVHFPSNMETTISGLTGYPLFGGTDTVLLYDLPATN